MLTLRVAPVNATAAALTVAADVLSRAHKPIALTASVQHSAASVGPLIIHFVHGAVSIPFRTASAACMAERRAAPHAARQLAAGRSVRLAERMLTGLGTLVPVQASPGLAGPHARSPAQLPRARTGACWRR